MSKQRDTKLSSLLEHAIVFEAQLSVMYRIILTIAVLVCSPYAKKLQKIQLPTSKISAPFAAFTLV